MLEFLPTFYKQTPTESPRVSTKESLDFTLIGGLKELGKELILLLILLNYDNIYSTVSLWKLAKWSVITQEISPF